MVYIILALSAVSDGFIAETRSKMFLFIFFLLFFRAWLQSVFIVTLIIAAPIGAGICLHMLKMDFVKVIAIGGLMLFEYLCLRFVGNWFSSL